MSEKMKKLPALLLEMPSQNWHKSRLLFHSQCDRNIEMGCIDFEDLSDPLSTLSSSIFQIRDLTFPQRQVFLHFDFEGRLLNIELRKNGAFPIKLLERTFQGEFNVYEDNCLNLDPKLKEANYYFDYYQEKVTTNTYLSCEMVVQVIEFLKELHTQYPSYELLNRIVSRYSWDGLLKDRDLFHVVYPTPITVLPPEIRPDLNPLFAVLQVTQGCWTHASKRGPCAFCASFRNVTYKEKTLTEIENHVLAVQKFVGAQRKNIRKIFLSDGDPMFSKRSSIDMLECILQQWEEISSFETFISTSAILSK